MLFFDEGFDAFKLISEHNNFNTKSFKNHCRFIVEMNAIETMNMGFIANNVVSALDEFFENAVKFDVRKPFESTHHMQTIIRYKKENVNL
jgi:hypothetical protein